jgi:hypothetical protein
VLTLYNHASKIRPFLNEKKKKFAEKVEEHEFRNDSNFTSAYCSRAKTLVSCRLLEQTEGVVFQFFMIPVDLSYLEISSAPTIEHRII